ncbi:hypothetical protein J4E91_003599 [Alternaria rosae]|nr:hypothetical protein J4E91_003599 [Alternaria rosae]
MANKGSRPKPHAKVQKQQPKSVPTSTPKPDPGPDKPDLTHDIVASKKRTGDDGFMPTAAQVAGLTAEISRVKNESMFSQNAYRGIQSQYDELVERHANTLNEENGLRDQLSQNQARCAQAEKRSKALEKEVEGLKQRMRRAGEALDVSAF